MDGRGASPRGRGRRTCRRDAPMELRRGRRRSLGRGRDSHHRLLCDLRNAGLRVFGLLPTPAAPEPGHRDGATARLVRYANHGDTTDGGWLALIGPACCGAGSKAAVCLKERGAKLMQSTGAKDWSEGPVRRRRTELAHRMRGRRAKGEARHARAQPRHSPGRVGTRGTSRGTSHTAAHAAHHHAPRHQRQSTTSDRAATPPHTLSLTYLG